jgi:hypothetical protein
MRRWVWKGPGTLVIAAFVLLVAPVSAEAAPPADLLPGGESLGEIDDVEGATGPVSGSGPCTSEAHPDGYGHAAVFRTTASEKSLLRMTVTDDLDGSLSLCRVDVHETEASDPPDAEPVESSEGCAAGASCSIERWLGAGKTYLVVLWATPPDLQPGTGQDASFSFDASVKRSAHLTTKIYGHRIKDGCTGYHEVVKGTVFKIVTTTTSAPTGIIQMTIERRVGSVWSAYASYERPLAQGIAILSLTAGSSGLFRITTRLPESATRLATAAIASVAHVTPKWHRYSDGGLRLKVPWYHQQLRLSCEGAALRMAHNFFKPGSIDRDMQVLYKIGIDKRPKKGNRWGNPNKVFVGRPNGRMMKTGYGVHYAPVAAAATKFSPCRPAIKLKKPSRATIARYVAQGFPVIVWGAHRGATGIYKKVWKAWDGDWITAWSVEHVWVVVGFHGKANKPTSFIIHNPSGGARRKVSLKQFDEFTKYFRRAVVVRG